MTSEPKLTPEEQRVYDLIKRETKSSGGIKQVLVRRHLELKDIDPKVVTQIVRKLIDMGLVEREVVNNGDKRYYVLRVKEAPSASNGVSENAALPHSRDSSGLSDSILLDIPCIKCRNLTTCGMGYAHDPLRCPLIAYFILEKSGIISRVPARPR